MSLNLTSGLDRFVEYVTEIAAGNIDPIMGTYPGLSADRWPDPERVPICGALEAEFDVVKREIQAISEAKYRPESEPIERSGDWTIFPVLQLGRRNESNALRLPATMAIAESNGLVETLTGALYVSRLRPGTTVAPHRGPTNTRIRCHLGIEVPRGDCAIAIEGEQRAWKEGSCLLLNDHLEHWVWNNADEDRIVLVVDVWHPDLSLAERKLLSGLHLFAEKQSEVFYRWHERRDAVERGLRPIGGQVQ